MAIATVLPMPRPKPVRRAVPRIAAAQLAALFALQGFAEGFGPLHAEAVDSDRQTYRRCRCGSCRRGGQLFRPFTKGERYKGLLECPACAAGTEV